jgi:hypothetical protein
VWAIALVVRAVLTRREIGVVTSAAAETARDLRRATLLLRRAAAIPPPPASTRPVDPEVVPAHGDVIVSEGPGDEVLRGEDVAARKPASNNWTAASREAWRGIDRQAPRRPSVARRSSTPDGRGGTSPSGRVPMHRNYNGRYRPQNRGGRTPQ